MEPEWCGLDDLASRSDATEKKGGLTSNAGRQKLRREKSVFMGQ